MKFKTIISQPLFWVNIIVIVIVIVKFALAWINPSGNPPSGGGVLYYSNGNVGIGTTAPGEKLEVSGNVKASAFLYSSDIRLKKDIQEIPDALEKILQLKGVSFKWKENDKKSIGLIAQNVEEIFPELVSTDINTDMKSLQYSNLVAVLIEAIKEQQRQIEEMKLKIEKLNSNSQ